MNFPLNFFLFLIPGNEYVGSGLEEERRFVLLKDVFKEFPKVPINIDIKVNDDQLIKEVAELIKEYDREEYTVWGNFRDEVTRKCYEAVCFKNGNFNITSLYNVCNLNFRIQMLICSSQSNEYCT